MVPLPFFFFFFFRERNKLQLYELKRETTRQKTKDKGQRTERKAGAPTSAHSGGLNTKARGPPLNPTPPHAPRHPRMGGASKAKEKKSQVRNAGKQEEEEQAKNKLRRKRQ
jgi:hypothetical protein